MDEELRRHRDHLEQLVDERTKELKQAQIATLSMMEDADEARQKAEVVSEELRAAQVATMNIMMDVEEARQRAEQANEYLQREKLFSDKIINSIPGIFYMFDENGRFIRWNKNFSTVTEYSDEEITQLHPTELFEGEEQAYIAARIQLVFYTGVSNAEAHIVSKGGTRTPYYLTGYRMFSEGKPILIGTGVDITEMKLVEYALADKADELARSNEELERFAYVASHDLQEPLRMVASYLQLLERRYDDKLDQDAKDFIGFAVDGATRMKRLINDLLAYSRVGTRGKPFEATDLNNVLGQVHVNLQKIIEENGALISQTEMPTVLADQTQMVQLFQNLISNGIKFRKEECAPQINVSVCDAGHEWQFSVKDNGIGFEQQYEDRIFVIFQRLHTKDKYTGTGIGLAVSKRIIERHGGRIWVESVPGEGATFYFTIPKLEEV